MRTSRSNKALKTQSFAKDLTLTYKYKIPILFQAYGFKSSNETPEKDPKSWTVYGREIINGNP